MTNTTNIETKNSESIRTDEERLENTKDMILGAADDFRKADAMIGAAAALCEEKHPKFPCGGEIDAEELKRSRKCAYYYWKRLETIADFSDDTASALKSLHELYRAPGFAPALWNIKDALRVSEDVFDMLGVKNVCETLTGAEDGDTVYDGRDFSLKDMLAHVIVLMYFMAHQFLLVPRAAKVRADLMIVHQLHADMLSAHNCMLELAPDDLRMSEREYAVCLSALNAGIHSAYVLELNARMALANDDAEGTWRKYSATDEAQEAKIAIISALHLCPLDIG